MSILPKTRQSQIMSVRILVIGSYLADRLQSMDQYTLLLVDQYRPVGHVSLSRPAALFRNIPLLPSVAQKYLAYLDKLVLFPLWLAFNSKYFDIVHIADHGFSYYSFFCNPRHCIVTCHDFLAVRGSVGDKESFTSASFLGPWLQALIMAGIRRAGSLVFVSSATFADYLLLGGGHPAQRHQVIPLSPNKLFSSDLSLFKITPEEFHLIPKSPFLLMIGSALPRKNRLLSIRVLNRLRSLSYKLVIAGAPLTNSEYKLISDLDLHDRVISIKRPSHALLNHLYCKSHSLLFPSFAEGFGWPVIEAQACGCPVIASTLTSIPEVAGEGALFADPLNDKAFADHVLTLQDTEFRNKLIQQGFTNLERYKPDVLRKKLANFALCR